MKPKIVYKVTTAATTPPVSTAEAKRQLIIEDDTSRDTELGEVINEAARAFERWTRRHLMPQTLTAYLDKFPAGRIIDLPACPLASITSVAYRDSDNASQTLASSKYTVDTFSEPGRLQLNYGESWPATYDRFDAVTITMVAGYADADSVPDDMKRAVKLLVQHFWDNRSPVSLDSAMPRDLPWSLRSLIYSSRAPTEWILAS